MNICLDFSPVVHQKAGLASYARELATHLLQRRAFRGVHSTMTATRPCL